LQGGNEIRPPSRHYRAQARDHFFWELSRLWRWRELNSCAIGFCQKVYILSALFCLNWKI